MRILYVDIDSLRPDHLGCYGYDRNTSPTIDSLADSGVRFDRCYVSDSPCLPSRTALATCRVGAKNGVVTHYGHGQWPGVTDGNEGDVVDEQVYQFDLLPTVCELAGIDVPSGWDAEPFTSALRGEEFEGREYVVSGHGIYVYSRAVYDGDWVFVRILHPGVYSHPGLYNDPELPERGTELLHNVSRDPLMSENLVDEYPEKATELRSELDGWTARTVATEDAGGTDRLAEMALAEGPFLYADPEGLAELYRDLGRTKRQIQTVERSREWRPRW